MPAAWWLKREAERYAQEGDFERAYKTLRDEVGVNVVEVRRDRYAEQLEQENMKNEQTIDALREALELQRKCAEPGPVRKVLRWLMNLVR